MRYADASDDEKLFDAMLADPGATISQLARAVGWITPTGTPYHMKVSRALKRLERLGCVKRDAMGQYLAKSRPLTYAPPEPSERHSQTLGDLVRAVRVLVNAIPTQLYPLPLNSRAALAAEKVLENDLPQQARSSTGAALQPFFNTLNQESPSPTQFPHSVDCASDVEKALETRVNP
jgi:hypothetical protein